MADLIDRQATLNALCDNCDTVQAVCPHFPCKRYTSVEALPSADVVEVVRCKDCIYWTQTIFGYACTISYTTNRITQPCDFCSFGIRKDGKQDEGLN